MFVFLLVLISLLLSYSVVQYRQFEHAPVFDQTQIIEVLPGEGVGRVLQRLELNSGMNAYWWKIWSYINREQTQIRSGEFKVNARSNPSEFIHGLAFGPFVQHRFTIIEGWTFKQMLQQLKSLPGLNSADLDADTIRAELGITADLEGQFLADTYFFTRGEDAMSLLKTSHQALKSALVKQWSERLDNLPFEKQYEILVLASIVEKETQLASEREKVAGVFVRRLKKGMRLQADPTVIYGMGDSYDGNIRRQDLRTDTPYNTYTRKGLPKGPICLVGMDSIYAVTHPDSSSDLYFVADGTGAHQFSENLKDHQRKVRKFQIK
ncbi:MAG: endolytic transglycosylase MltG [bacterium]